jgi:hypothetical protein
MKRIWAFLQRVRCKHPVTVRFHPTGVQWYNRKTGETGVHTAVEVEGCLTCNKTWMRGYHNEYFVGRKWVHDWEVEKT